MRSPLGPLRPFAAPGLALALAVAVAACAQPEARNAVPLDRLVYPTALAVRDGTLLVLSSNQDLTYDAGSVAAVDLATDPPAIAAAVPIGSLGGELAVAEADACGLDRPELLATSRKARRLYRLQLDEAGHPSCGDGCEVPLEDGPLDPYAVAVSCPAGGPARAWVGYLRADGNEGWLTALDLATGARSTVEVASAAPRSLAYDAEADRLLFTTSETWTTAPLGWIELSGGCVLGADAWEGGCPVRSIDLADQVAGLELAGLALSNPQDGLTRRAYVAAHVFDTDVAEASGERPSTDLGGLLLVLELATGPDGALAPALVRTVQLGLGASEVRVLPARAGRRDLVAVTAFDDELLAIYDDDAGAVRRVFTRDETTGAPLVGGQPFGLAVEPRDAATARVYVGSFEDGFVSAVDVPLDAPWDAALVTTAGATSALRIGQVSR